MLTPCPLRPFAQLLLLATVAHAALADAKDSVCRVADLPPLSDRPLTVDWLLDGSPYTANVYRTGQADEIILDNGLLRRTFRLTPNAATVGFDNLASGQALLRAVKPEAIVTIDGVRYEVGGLKGQPDHAYLLPEWIDSMTANPAALQFAGFEVSRPQARLTWKQVRHHAPEAKWPPPGVALRMDYTMPPVATDRSAESRANLAQLQKVRLSVHYELYDGVPVLSKWITVHNGADRKITIDHFTSELLAAVEHSSAVEDRGTPKAVPNIHVQTDYAFGSFVPDQANRYAVHWLADPEYLTQVNYLRQTPCLLEIRPTLGPDQDVAPGGTFESFRAFLLPYDSTDRERKSLALRRMHRVVAPWVTENPLMMHVRWSDLKTVHRAIDQCAEVGFEMIILTFGSGFNIENDNSDYLATMQGYADAARAKGIEIGGYSLLASRSVGGGNDVVSPPGERPTFGHCPALTSSWGQDYFHKLTRFFDQTGFRLLEHDGSYPGDLDVTVRLPLQKGLLNSRWAQWKVITGFYKHCRAQGIYLNVPDYYYLSGSNKCGMGYRETNWSLPRAQQVLHTRQNIYDGTWTKTPSMGWMFVPLTQYQGGGSAATIEPLDAHRDHYRRMLESNLAFGVQACYRGPRLYDTDRTRQLVKHSVDWFKKYRDILESDVIHGRRADGRSLDWMLHVNPKLHPRGLLVVFNPSLEPIKKTLQINLYYTGLADNAQIRVGEGPLQTYPLDRKYRVSIPVEVEGQEMSYLVIE